jgi:hypothetical protein
MLQFSHKGNGKGHGLDIWYAMVKLETAYKEWKAVIHQEADGTHKKSNSVHHQVIPAVVGKMEYHIIILMMWFCCQIHCIVTRETMPPNTKCSQPPYVQPTILDMSHTTVTGHLPHSVLEHHYAEATTSASELQALHAALLKQFPAIMSPLSSLPVR